MRAIYPNLRSSGSILLKRHCVDPPWAAPAAMVVAGALDHQAELLGDPLGRSVAGVDDGDEPVNLEDVASVVAAGRRRFGGQATALERGAHVIADLDLS